MRKYQLKIGEVTDQGGQLILDVSSDNPQGCQIDFDIQQYSVGQTVNAEITLYNISPYYFSMNQSLIKKSVYLYAGMQKTPLLDRIGYKGKYGLIAQGYISRVIPEWNGNDAVITITFQPFLIEDSTDNINRTAYELNVSAKTDIIKAYKTIFEKIGGNPKTLDMGSLPIPYQQDYQEKIYTISDLNGTLQSQHKLSLLQRNNGFVLSNQIQQNIKLVPGDFLTQPALTAYNKIAITLIMRADIQIGDTVELPPEIFVGITALDKGTPTIGIPFQGQSIFTLFHGKYLVTGVWQVGDSRNTEAQSWSTIIDGALQ